MGRYYTGDIEGKFWFAVQSSTDASFFGGTEFEPSTITYSFDKTDITDVEDGIKKCNEALGKYKVILGEYFSKHKGYNDKEMSKDLKITEEKLKDLLEWYARLELGNEIRTCLIEKGHCEFEAEL